MSHVLSLIAARPKDSISQADLDAAGDVLASAGSHIGLGDWLSPSEAWEAPFPGDPEAVLVRVRAAFAGRFVDVNVVPASARRKRLLVADMDSTLIQQECIDELAAEAGLGAEVAAITESAMRGEIAFEPALRARVALLKGLPTELADKVLAERIALMPGGAVMVATMRSARAYTALVSGGFTLFAGPIADRLGFDEFRANVLLAKGGRLTGAVIEPVLGREAKEETLLRLSQQLGLGLAETMAVGDGANDIGMVRLAGMGVAFRAKPILREAADAAVDHADLTGLLFLQGFRRAEFADAA